MKTNYNNLPDELKRRGLFCLWRYEKVKGRLSKIPYSLRGCKAKSTDRISFCSFGSALKVVDKYSGIGLGIFDGYCAVDIDHCVADGRLSELALDVINAMNSYTEYSPSGEGVRIIFRADGFKYDKQAYYINNHKIGLEIYVSGSTNKYVTLTGNVIRNVPIAERGDKLSAVLEKYMKKPTVKKTDKPMECRSYLSDGEVIEKAINAKNGKKFSELWSGNFDKSHSEADLALCSMLAFWCGGDSAQIDRLFHQSALYRKKWERKDYREETLKKAVNGCSEVYLQRTNASEDFSDSLMDKLIKLHPEQNQKYPQTDIGAGRLFADCFKDIARYVPERKCWYCYSDGVWKQDVGNLRAMEYLKELADALLGYALTIESEFKRTEYIKFCSKWQKRHNRDTHLDGKPGKLSSSTVRRYYTMISSLMKSAYRLGLIGTNPAEHDSITLPKLDEETTEIFTETELDEMLEALEDEPLMFRLLIHLALNTGCRRGELMGLKWSDIDLAPLKRHEHKERSHPPRTYPAQNH